MAIYSSIFNIALRILSIAVYLLTIFAAYGGWVNPHIWAFPSMVTLILPYAAIATAILVVIWLCRRKIIMAVAGVLTLVGCISQINTVVPLSFSKTPHQGETTFTLISYNILHTDDRKMPDFSPSRSISYLLKSGADIICLQEIGFADSRESPLITDAQRDSLSRKYPYIILGGRQQLSILSRYPVKPSAHRSEYLTSYQIYDLEIKGHKLAIVNVHLAPYSLNEEERRVLSGINSMASARHSMSEFKGEIRAKLGDAFRLRAMHADKVRQILDSIPGNVIVCGDFNDVPASWTYRTIVGNDMKDAFRNTHFGPMITYNAHAFWFNIDHVLYRGDLRALSLKRADLNSSDHYPLEIEFAFERTPKTD